MSEHPPGTDGENDSPGDEPHASTEWYADRTGVPGAVPAQPTNKRFRAATDDELDPNSWIMASDRSALRAVLRGGSIADDRGDASFIGGAIRELARTLREAAEAYRRGGEFVSNALLRHFAFGHSVTLELEIGSEESVQLGVEGGRHSPTIDAARAVAALLASDPEQVVPRAAELGPEAAASYKRFLNLIGGDNVTLEWHAAEATEVVVVTSADARRDFAILDAAGDQVTEAVQVPGRLTMADSELQQFALTLPAELARPPLLKGKHRLRGTFWEAMSDKLKSKGSGTPMCGDHRGDPRSLRHHGHTPRPFVPAPRRGAVGPA